MSRRSLTVLLLALTLCACDQADSEVVTAGFAGGGTGGGLGAAADASIAVVAARDASVEIPITLPDAFAALPLAEPAVSDLAPYDQPPEPVFFTGVSAPRPTPPISGGTLAVGANGKAVISDPDRDQIYVVDLAAAHVETLTLNRADEPGRVVIDQGRAYVTLRNGGSLATIELSSARISQQLPICAAPRGLALDSVGARLLVACAGGDLVSVSADAKRVLSRARIAPDLRDVGRDAEGLWVSQFRAAKLFRLDEALHVTGSQAPNGPNVSLLPGTSERFTPTLAWRTVSAPSGEVFMLHQRATSGTVPTKPSQTDAGVPQSSPYGLSVITPQAPQREFCSSVIVHATITRFGTGEPRAHRALIEAVLPSDLAFAPDGKRFALVAPGNFARQEAGRPAGQLYISNADMLARTGTTPTLVAPDDCLSNAVRWEQRFPGEATALAFADANTLLVYVRNPAELHVLRFDERGAPRLSAIIPLANTDLRDSGHEIFHQNTGGGIACVSCHGEALDDGHVWNFDFGPRRTQHLRGSVIGHAPFHWSADLPGVDQLVSEVYQRRMGGIPLAPRAVATLTQWLASTSYVHAEPGESERVARGRALFESSEVGCASCHASAELRSEGLHDVGSGGPFKVPSLHGAALRLPLMHTGCADTLEKRFDPACGGVQHGNTSQLSSEQLADLIAYLASL